MPGPSSEMTISTVSRIPPRVHLHRRRARNRRRFRGCCRRRKGSRDCVCRPARACAATAIRTLISTPKSRCGATVSSISVDSGMRSNGAPEEDSWVILARMSRQRCACSRSVLRSAASGSLPSTVFLQLARNQEDRRQRRAEFVRGGGGKAVDLGQMLLARQHQFGRRQRVGKLARLLGDLERIEAGDADREHDREPDAEQIDRRQHQRIVDCPTAAADGRTPAPRRRRPRAGRSRPSSGSAAPSPRSKPAQETGTRTGSAGRR